MYYDNLLEEERECVYINIEEMVFVWLDEFRVLYLLEKVNVYD